MNKRQERVILFFSDFIFINLGWVIYYLIRIESGWIAYTAVSPFVFPLLFVYLFWVIVFTFSGLYQYWFVRSRFDELSSVAKVVSLGCLFLFVAIFLDDALKNEKAISRYLILIYWLLMIVCVGTGRIILRSFQAGLLQKGIGLRDTLIIGIGQRGSELNSLINKFPQLGYRVIGFISPGKKETENNEVLGQIKDLSKIINQRNITEILIALEKKDKDKLFEIIGNCPPDKVNLKILPDTYEIVSGLVKTNQLYGVPLIEVMPQIMSYGGLLTKRIIDIFISLGLLLFMLPIILFCVILIKISSEGSIFYVQTRIGKNNRSFRMYKFRTMIKEAEEYGPEWSGEQDPRITKIGRYLRKVYFDELPQLYNVLRNEMSIVGPRPERPHFVELLKKQIPYYYKRMSIKPGITGWAQVKHKYDSSLDDVIEKLQYDFYYIENMSLKLDFKIMINTALVIILMKGH